MASSNSGTDLGNSNTGINGNGGSTIPVGEIITPIVQNNKPVIIAVIVSVVIIILLLVFYRRSTVKN